jgi:hypothetical protein
VIVQEIAVVIGAIREDECTLAVGLSFFEVADVETAIDPVEFAKTVGNALLRKKENTSFSCPE